MKNPRRFAFDLVRFVAVFCILLCHFNARYSFVYFGEDLTDYMLLNQYPFRLFLGDLGVSLFFIISGATLYYNHYDSLDLKSFYKKRFLSIYPMFWIAYLVLFILRAPKMLASGTPIGYMFFTLIGMDGYLAGVLPTFYLIGEWFLGAIILLYIIFPLIRKIYRYNKFLTWSIALALYALFICVNLFPGLSKSSIIFIRIPELLFGMTYTDILKKRSEVSDEKTPTPWYGTIGIVVRSIIAIVILAVSATVDMVWNNSIQTTLVGCACFILLTEVSEAYEYREVGSGQIFASICAKVAMYSYAVYLVHHVIIDIICEHMDMLSLVLWQRIGLFMAIVVCISVVAVALNQITGTILKMSKSFHRKEQI